MPTVTLPNNGWTPRPYQRPLWDYLESGGKRAVAIWNRRSGKDEIVLHRTAVSAFERVGTYWHMLPEAAQAKKAIWNAVNPHTGIRRIDEAFPHEIRASTNNQEMFIRFINGSTWQVVGSDNFNSLVGSPPIGVVLSEWALANPNAWGFLSPILEENGGWAAFITTPRGKNHAHKMYQSALSRDRWFAQLLTVEDTGVVNQESLDEILTEYQDLYGDEQGKAFFLQEWYCSWAASILGSIYGEFIARAERAGRIGEVPYDPMLPVNTSWDLGYDDTTVIWFWQAFRSEVRVIDVYCNSGKDIDHYCDVLKARDYEYGEGKHYVPHDAAIKTLQARGKSLIEQAHENGVKFHVVPATSQENQIAALRSTLRYCWFDEVKCAEGLEALRQYHFKWDEKRRAFSSTPHHDWTSDYADAAEIMGVVWQEQKPAKEEDSDGIRKVTPDMWKQLRRERYGNRA